mmetsp:Transcript_38353/g.57865  ORF Transcript_38353/g.57865 Transcript_38353/m.57865 type:complete len:230 (+) Transcript_38353:223-912(+)
MQVLRNPAPAPELGTILSKVLLASDSPRAKIRPPCQTSTKGALGADPKNPVLVDPMSHRSRATAEITLDLLQVKGSPHVPKLPGIKTKRRRRPLSVSPMGAADQFVAHPHFTNSDSVGDSASPPRHPQVKPSIILHPRRRCFPGLQPLFAQGTTLGALCVMARFGAQPLLTARARELRKGCHSISSIMRLNSKSKQLSSCSLPLPKSIILIAVLGRKYQISRLSSPNGA